MKTLIRFFVIILIGYAITSCDEIAFSDDFLGSEPDREGATLDTMFSSAINSDKVLTTAYANLPYPLSGSIRGGSRIPLECFTDLNHTYVNNNYYTGTMNAVSNGWTGGSNWTAVRYAWIYLENIDKVADMTKADKDIRKAEAKTIIALAYSEMLRNIGGLPWIDHSIEVTETMEFPRQTFAQTVDSVVTLLDKAIPYLKWNQNSVDDGRMTKAGAMALKLRVLLYAASPAFNSNTLWHSGADTYTCYTNEDKGRWNRAKKAGEEFMVELEKSGYYGLVQTEEEDHESYRLAFRKGYYERGTGEALISTRRGYDAGSVHSGYWGERYYSGPTLNYVNMFSWADGSDFPENFNWANPATAPFYDVDGNPTRDPRLYETVAVPGAYYYNGTLAPVYWGHDSYSQGSSTGFQMMKFILAESSDRANIGAHWPYLRLPEVLLSYAEAINENEGGPNNTAYNCINDIRKRVGLSELPRGLNKEAFREALLKERILEFGQEEVRWYDIVRWNLSDVFKEKLYYLNSYVKTMEGSTPTSFTFKANEITDRYWRTAWDSKWYLLPLPQSEVDKNYGWTQNPGW